MKARHHYNKWSAEDIEQLKSGKSDAELATLLGRSESSIRGKRFRLGISPDPAPAYDSTVAQDLALKDESFWRREHSTLQKKYETLLKEQNAVERLVSRIADLAPRRYSPAPTIHRSTRKSSGAPQSAVLMFSDTHIGKNVKASQTLQFGTYDFATFLARLKYLEESIISIAQNHVTTKVPELVIAMMGDMLDGALSHSNEVGQLDPLFNQYYCGGHAIAQFFRNLAPHFPKLRIFDVVGNHTRFHNQRKMPTKNRYSNYDKFLYALVRELIRDIPNIEWTLDAQPYQLFEVQGFTFFAAHGDSLRGGDKTLGVPNHAVGRLVSTATQLLNKYNRKAPNYYLVGHLHRDIVLPHATGSFLVNGGFPGVDEFGLSEMFTPADPTQKFFFIHPQYGKTATYDISLKFAEPSSQPAYVMPDEFQMN